MWVSAKKVKEFYNITSQTLHNWRLKDKIIFKRLESGSIVYQLEMNENKTLRKNIIYSRVSNTKQKEDLLRQTKLLQEYMISNGIKVDIIYEDIASGMNEDRKHFNSLIEDVMKYEIDTVYITYKDRLTRFGFSYFEKFFKKYDTKIEVLNTTKEEDFQTELTQDLISIIHHFSMKMYSNRKKILKELKNTLENESL